MNDYISGHPFFSLWNAQWSHIPKAENNIFQEKFIWISQDVIFYNEIAALSTPVFSIHAYAVLVFNGLMLLNFTDPRIFRNSDQTGFVKQSKFSSLYIKLTILSLKMWHKWYFTSNQIESTCYNLLQTSKRNVMFSQQEVGQRGPLWYRQETKQSSHPETKALLSLFYKRSDQTQSSRITTEPSFLSYRTSNAYTSEGNFHGEGFFRTKNPTGFGVSTRTGSVHPWSQFSSGNKTYFLDVFEKIYGIKKHM